MEITEITLTLDGLVEPSEFKKVMCRALSEYLAKRFEYPGKEEAYVDKKYPWLNETGKILKLREVLANKDVAKRVYEACNENRISGSIKEL